MPSLKSTWAHFFPPKPQFKEQSLPDLEGKVYVVTGSNTGIGKEIARLLYSKNAKVYVVARTEAKAQKAIADIKASAPSSSGSLIYIPIDLTDLRSVKAAAESFLAQEQQLHTLFNNAGIMGSDPLQRTVQGYELSLGVNCVGTLLFTELLTPILTATAKASLAHTVRVIWPSSFGAEISAHKDVGIATDNLDYHARVAATDRYGLSKAGVWALAVEYGHRHGPGKDDIVSVAVEPGNVRSELQRDQNAVFKLLTGIFLYPTINAAYTQLYAAFSPEAAAADMSETWVSPFGRILPLRSDLPRATKLESDGGTGGTAKFWEWTQEQVKEYL